MDLYQTNHSARLGRNVFRAIGTAIIIFLSILSTANIFAASGRDTAEEYANLQRLEAVASSAVDHFVKATEAMDAGDRITATENYQQVLKAAPNFVPAIRRLSYVIDDKERALQLARRAYELEEHPYNTRAVIHALIALESQETWKEAAGYVSKLMEEDPDSVDSLAVVCQAALQIEQIELFQSALNKLRQLAPDDMITHYFSGIEAITEEDWIKAEYEIMKAHALGLPEEVTKNLLEQSGIRNKARLSRVLILTGYGMAAWAAGLVLLLLTGMLLSRVTLVAIETQGGSIQMEKGGMRLMRQVYAIILGLTSIYFYISIPIVILLIIGGVGGLIYSFFLLGRIPIKLVAIIAIVGLVTVFAMIKSLFIRVRDEDPGPRLQESDAPSIFAALREISSRMGAPMVDKVFIVPDATLAVFERGSFWQRFSKRSEKCLILGLGVLNGMTQLQLKSILAHEFGHISNRDTAGGSMALHVRRSIGASAEAMAEGGAAEWYNPGWLFIHAFYRIFLRVSQGASRLQEVLADRWAVLAYGSSAFIEGLKHVIHNAIEYDLISKMEIQCAIQEKRQLNNLYALDIPEKWPETNSAEEETLESSTPDTSSPENETPKQAIARTFEQALKEPTSPYDSHPAPGQRIAWVSEISSVPELEDDQSLAWDMLENSRALQHQVVSEINDQVQEYIESNL